MECPGHLVQPGFNVKGTLLRTELGGIHFQVIKQILMDERELLSGLPQCAVLSGPLTVLQYLQRTLHTNEIGRQGEKQPDTVVHPG